MTLILMAVLGLIIGHIARRLAPIALRMPSHEFDYTFPFAEILGAILFALTVYVKDLGWHITPSLVMIALLLLVSTADAVTRYIPGLACYIGAPIGIALNAIFPSDIIYLVNQDDLLSIFGISVYQQQLAGLVLAASGAASGFILIEFVRRVFMQLLKMEAMGFGDTLLMMVIGAYIGPRAVIFCLFPACIVGIAIGLIRMLMTGKHHLAFGPALAAGAVIMSLFGNHMVQGFVAFQNFLVTLPPAALLGFSLFLVIVLLILLAQMRKKASQWEEEIEEDYAEVDAKMK